jgi:hypothetical protein
VGSPGDDGIIALWATNPTGSDLLLVAGAGGEGGDKHSAISPPKVGGLFPVLKLSKRGGALEVRYTMRIRAYGYV